ncbi:MAG TPA: hypothetical protein VH079_07825 [Terriglobales bacterium]|jgi:tetratricopeptide (TPR) repeat protein|nr:hypothetical protein [Terriglobales bacterium]
MLVSLRCRALTKKYAFTCVAFLGTVSSVSLQAQSQFGTELNEGTQAYRQAKFEEAIDHFQKAVSLDPQSKAAHLYLATALAGQYIPGVDVAENLKIGQVALDEFQKALDLDPKSLDSMKGIASLDFAMKRFEAAKQVDLRIIELEPGNPEFYYAIGILDWTQSYTRRMELRGKLGLDPAEPLINAKECWDLRNDDQDLVKDGIGQLAKALQLRRDYDDAMAYMNLLYRERADIQCGDIVSYRADVQTAGKWVDATLAVKKEKAAPKTVVAPPNNPQ